MFRSFLNTLIARIGKDTFLFAVQQMVCLGNIVFICGSGMDAVDYRRAIINANMRLHAEVPLIAFLRRAHFWIAATTYDTPQILDH